MNNTELKTLHTSLQNKYNRSLIPSKPKDYLPVAIGEFAKELAINPLLEYIRLNIANIGKEALRPFQEAKTAALEETDSTIRLLYSYKEVIPELTWILEEYEKSQKNCLPNSNDTIYISILTLEKACHVLLGNYFQGDHNIKNRNELLEKLVKRDDKGDITEPIFAPSLPKYFQEMEIFERDQKTGLYYSLHYLIWLYRSYDIRKLPNILQGFLDDNHLSAASLLNLKSQKLSQILDGQKVDSATLSEFDVEECKIHMNRVWTFIQKNLLSPEIQNINQENSSQENSYNDDGILIRKNSKPMTFTRNSLRGKILGLLHPGGNPSPKTITFEDIYYDSMKSAADPEWYELDGEEMDNVNSKIREAIRGINERSQNEIGILIIKVHNTTVKLCS